MKHGRSGYMRGCKCGVCVGGQRDYMRTYQRQVYKAAATAVCPVCGDPLARNTIRMHNLCRERLRRAALRRRRATQKLAAASAGTRSRYLWTQGRCAYCGVEFCQRGGIPMAYCSKRHKTRAALNRRKARERGAFVADVSPAKVFAADGYRCHLCGKKTDRSKSVPHPKAPTIDHVVPLACGGTHEPSNCRTAHFKCNYEKGDRLAGDQLALQLAIA